MVMPIGPLMIEHRLIERMLRALQGKAGIIEGNDLDVELIGATVDFLRTYADRCHHGKEEGILFRELGRKPLTTEHQRIIEELMEEHAWARSQVGELVEAAQRFERGERAAGEAHRMLQGLMEFYPKHIAKEDKQFFIPAMGYFNVDEQDAMLQEEYEFDRTLIHEKYKSIVESVETRLGDPADRH